MSSCLTEHNMNRDTICEVARGGFGSKKLAVAASSGPKVLLCVRGAAL